MNFVIKGQIKSGKNAMQITRTGRHYPLKAFSDWREVVMNQLQDQIPVKTTLEGPQNAYFTYHPGDLRRRDVPGMIDALFHVFERFGLVKDDAQFENVHWMTMPVNRSDPKVEVTIFDKSASGGGGV